MTTSNVTKYNYVSINTVLGKELTPDTIKGIFNGVYIPDHTVIKVIQQHKESPITASVIDMRVYPNQWVVMTKLENGLFREFSWPYDKFYT